MATPNSKGKPMWLALQDVNDPLLNKHYRRSVKYYKQLYLAWPEWCSTHTGFKMLKDEWRRRKKAGEDVEIDHIVPIMSALVCGLHVPWNLAIITSAENRKKSNLWWPDHPFTQLELFYEPVATDENCPG